MHSPRACLPASRRAWPRDASIRCRYGPFVGVEDPLDLRLIPPHPIPPRGQDGCFIVIGRKEQAGLLRRRAGGGKTRRAFFWLWNPWLITLVLPFYAVRIAVAEDDFLRLRVIVIHPGVAHARLRHLGAGFGGELRKRRLGMRAAAQEQSNARGRKPPSHAQAPQPKAGQCYSFFADRRGGADQMGAGRPGGFRKSDSGRIAALGCNNFDTQLGL